MVGRLTKWLVGPEHCTTLRTNYQAELSIRIKSIKFLSLSLAFYFIKWLSFNFHHRWVKMPADSGKRMPLLMCSTTIEYANDSKLVIILAHTTLPLCDEHKPSSIRWSGWVCGCWRAYRENLRCFFLWSIISRATHWHSRKLQPSVLATGCPCIATNFSI